MKKCKIAENFFYFFVKVTGIIPALIVFRPRVKYYCGKPDINGGLLVVCNHNSMTDPVILLTVFKTRRPYFVATAELFSSKLGRWFFNHVRCIEVNKQNFSMSTFKQVSNELNKGEMVCIFPEGSVHDDSAINPFKSGAVLMALKNNVPILPVYISKRKHWYNCTDVTVGSLFRPELTENDAFSVERMNKIAEDLHKIETELKESSEAIK